MQPPTEKSSSSSSEPSSAATDKQTNNNAATPNAAPADQDIAAQCHGFIDHCQTLVMASLTDDQQPHASYSPFARDDAGNNFILISELSQHYQTLRNSQRVSVLYLADEAASKQPYARTRCSSLCNVSFIDREQPQWQTATALLQNKFGSIVATLTSLGDFHLVQLSPQSMQYVSGFARAYTLIAPDFTRIEHIDPRQADNQ